MITHSQLEGKNILITGGAGFIGSNLCDFFVNSGSYVKCFDNLSTGNKKNIQHLIPKNNFEFIENDIRDYKSCLQASLNIDFVLHQAALGSVPRSINDPIKSNEVNISGFLNMLYAAKENNVKRFIYAASSSTYGDSEKLPKVEHEIGKPLSPYAITKYVNELYAHNFKMLYNFDSIGLRYFNVFGPRQDPNGQYAAVIPIFINKFIRNESPTINGNGLISRDFTHVDNVVLANALSILTNDENSLNQVYNVACGNKTSLNDLVVHLNKLTKKNITAKFTEPRAGDVFESLADISKISNNLKYYVKTNFVEGLINTYKWNQSQFLLNKY